MEAVEVVGANGFHLPRWRAPLWHQLLLERLQRTFPAQRPHNLPVPPPQMFLAFFVQFIQAPKLLPVVEVLLIVVMAALYFPVVQRRPGRDRFVRKKIRCKINRRPSQIKNRSLWSQGQLKRRERAKSSVRAKVERVFAVVKGLFRYRKTRYRGLTKQVAALNMRFTLANLILADRPSLAA